MALNRVALDTSAYSAFKRGERASLEVIRRAGVIGVPAAVIGELLAGFAGGARETRNREELASFLESPRVEILPLTEVTADFYARIFASLKRKGKPIPTNDLWIAAAALQQGFALLTFDRHFRHVEGLATGAALSDFLP